jgi:hypothetical protein
VPQDESNKTSVLIGAGSALVGAFLGAAASVIIAFVGFHHTDADRIRDQREAAYISFLQNMLDTIGAVRDLEITARQANSPGGTDEQRRDLRADLDSLSRKIAGLYEPLANMRIYGSSKTVLLADNTVAALAFASQAATHSIHEQDLDSVLGQPLSEANSLISQFSLAVRHDLDIPAD